MNHDTFVNERGVPNGLFLLHANITHYIKATWSINGDESPTHELVHMQYLMGNGGHLVQWLYHGIRTQAATPLQALRDKWNVDLDRELRDKEWNTIVEYPRKVSRSAKFKFIQLMIVHRAYLTPSRLHKMFQTTTDNCPRCQEHNTDLIHILWSCSRLQHFWKGVHEMLKEIAPGQRLYRSTLHIRSGYQEQKREPNWPLYQPAVDTSETHNHQTL